MGAIAEDRAVLLEETVLRWRSSARVVGIEPLTPDASLRRYYRLLLDGAGEASVVAMVFESAASPEYDVGTAVRSDDAYVELTAFLEHYGVQVPRLLFDARASAVLLIEDLGDRLLISTILGEPKAAEEFIDHCYRAAVDELVKIQRIPRNDSFFAFGRFFKPETYYREMCEFRDFVLAGLLDEPALKVVENGFALLAQELEAMPKVLCHRDFHAWNLIVDARQRVRVIDFQDALLATPAYDIVGLLNDRDSDAALGAPRYTALLDYFCGLLGSPPRFLEDYRRVLLQRDLKVAGRFCKLSRRRGLVHYEQWVPGTLRRIGRTLSAIRTAEGCRTLADFEEVICERVPAVLTGREEGA